LLLAAYLNGMPVSVRTSGAGVDGDLSITPPRRRPSRTRFHYPALRRAVNQAKMRLEKIDGEVITNRVAVWLDEWFGSN
jgi:hypothetical protein